MFMGVFFGLMFMYLLLQNEQVYQIDVDQNQFYVLFQSGLVQEDNQYDFGCQKYQVVLLECVLVDFNFIKRGVVILLFMLFYLRIDENICGWYQCDVKYCTFGICCYFGSEIVLVVIDKKQNDCGQEFRYGIVYCVNCSVFDFGGYIVVKVVCCWFK